MATLSSRVLSENGSAADSPDGKSSSGKSVDGAARFWHASAPKPIVKAASRGDAAAAWDKWIDHLKGRKIKPLAGAAGSLSPLAWTPPDGALDEDSSELIARLYKITRGNRAAAEGVDQLLRPWLAEAEGAEATHAFALEALAWCYALPQLAAHLPQELWREAIEFFRQTADDAAALQLEADPLARQLLAGELPLAIGALFPEINRCQPLAAAARRTLSRDALALLDGRGYPRQKYLPQLRPLLACWTRAELTGRQTEKGCFDKKAFLQYQWLVSAALSLVRRDGSQMLGRESSGRWQQELFETAIGLSDDPSDRDLAGLILPRCKTGGAQGGAAPKYRKPAYKSGWAGLAILRPSWQRGGTRLAAAWGDYRMKLELNCGREIVLDGDWDAIVELDGAALAPAGDWEEICWASDRDVDYLELEIDLQKGVRLQRQIILARKDGFLFLADAVISKQPGRIEYCSRLPLGAGVRYAPADESREAALEGKRRRAMLLPLALGEWRADPRFGELSENDGALQLRQTLEGAALYAPLWIDLERRRLSKPLTWRRLTVAENREIQPLDRAAGHRVQVGADQWLVYRSLTPARNRTLLGHNLSTEFVLGRFHRGTGETKELIEIK